MLYSGCYVTSGNGRAFVSAVGGDTEFGNIAREQRAAVSGLTAPQPIFAIFGRVIAVAGFIVDTLGFELEVDRFVTSGSASFVKFSEVFYTSIMLIVDALRKGPPTIVDACFTVSIVTAC